jgi:prepilin-type N-terminal cleavage/methylation domain-containing protein
MKKNPRAGLTLVELLVVLVILAVMTVIAVQSTEYLVEQARYNATQKTLQNVQDAIVGPTGQRAQDGSQLITGFVADMGRLPQPVYSGGVIVGDPLRELWDATIIPSGAGYANQSVTVANNTPTPASTVLKYPASSVYNPTAAAVTVTGTLPCGWRGPYLQLPIGSGALLDGWGNPLQSLYQVPGSTVFPSVPAAAAGTTPAQPINIVCSRGADNTFDIGTQTNAYNVDQYVPVQTTSPLTGSPPLVNFSDRINSNSLVSVPSIPVVVKTLNSTTSPATLTDPYTTGATDNTVEIVLFAPVGGVLTPIYAVNTAAGTSTTYFTITGAAPGGTPVSYTFPNVTTGPRAVQAFQFSAATGNVTKRSQMLYVMVPTGGVPTQTLILQ